MRVSSPNNAFSLYDMEPIIREVLDSGGEFELAPRGTSMLPLIKEGRDTVTLVSPMADLLSTISRFTNGLTGNLFSIVLWLSWTKAMPCAVIIRQYPNRMSKTAKYLHVFQSLL